MSLWWSIRWCPLYEVPLYVCLSKCFYHVPPSIFAVYLRCINHDIVAGLCSELLMRLSYQSHLGFVKKLSSHVGIQPWTRAVVMCFVKTVNKHIILCQFFFNFHTHCTHPKMQNRTESEGYTFACNIIQIGQQSISVLFILSYLTDLLIVYTCT